MVCAGECLVVENARLLRENQVLRDTNALRTLMWRDLPETEVTNFEWRVGLDPSSSQPGSRLSHPRRGRERLLTYRRDIRGNEKPRQMPRRKTRDTSMSYYSVVSAKKEMSNRKKNLCHRVLVGFVVVLIFLSLFIYLVYRTIEYFARYSILSGKSLLILFVLLFILAIFATIVNIKQKIDVLAKKIADPPDLWALLIGITMVFLPFVTTGQTVFYDGTDIGPALYQWLFFLTAPLSFFGMGFLNEYFQKDSFRQEGSHASASTAKYGFQYIIFMSFTILPILLGSAKDYASENRANAKAIIDSVLRDRDVYIDDSKREILKSYVGDFSQGSPSPDVTSALKSNSVFERAQELLNQADRLISDNPNAVFESSMFIFFGLLFFWFLLVSVGFLAERASSRYDRSIHALGNNSSTSSNGSDYPVPTCKYSSKVQVKPERRCSTIFGYIFGVGVVFSLFRRLK